MKDSVLCIGDTSLLMNLQRLVRAPAAQAHGLNERALQAQNAVTVEA